MAQQTPYPVRVEADYPDKSSRLLALLAILFFIKWLLLVPHLIVLYFLVLLAFIAAAIGYFAVIFTGKYPRGLFNFVLGVTRWQIRANLWLLGLTDRYPPFRLT